MSPDLAAPTLFVTPVVACLCATLYGVLIGRVVHRRWQTGVDLLDGGDPVLLRRIRAHANLAETAPLALLLLLLLELQGAGTPMLAVLGALFVAGRLVHAWALAWADSRSARIAGMGMTCAALFFLAVLNLWAVVAVWAARAG